MSDLQPPSAEHHEYDDPGAHEMASSDSDHFSSASEGIPEASPRQGRTGTAGSGHSHTLSSSSNSPIPITRVERVDEEPRHGEVPNTEAYKKRTADAVPDEVEIIPDGQRSRASSRLRPEDRPASQGGSPTGLPKMVVEKIDPDEPAYGDVPGTEAYEKRKADALPDEVIRSPSGQTRNPWNASSRSTVDAPTTTAEQTQAKKTWEEQDTAENDADEDDEEEDGFGDEFDEFAEGEQAAEDDDFGDFDDGFAATTTDGQPAPITPSLSAPQRPIPTPDLRNLSPDELQAAIKPYIHDLFPTAAEQLADPSKFEPQTTPFLTDRSLSLWQQLVAPPPISPPNWTRSHIRRLFLVSIGVPLDLDEVLPKSTQKKLILPSFDYPGRSPSFDERPAGAADRLRMQHTNGSDSSLASTESRTASKDERRRKRETMRGPPPPPSWDASAATLLARVTEEALRGFTDEELKTHVDSLFESERVGRDVLRYWEDRVVEAGREKEAFEGVIENLVKHARSVRK